MSFLTNKETPKMYTCVHCGHFVPYLYKRYNPTVLKLENCDVCGEIADKYIEYDKVIIMIDMVLLNRQAYRHIVFNSCFENHWKLSIVLILLEICLEWVSLHDHQESVDANVFEIDERFYVSCFSAILGFLSWWTSVYFISAHIGSVVFCDTLKLWKAMVLASCSKFLVISQLIWGELQSSLYTSLITIYVFLSEVQALSVITSKPRYKAAFIIFFSMSLKLYVQNIFKPDSSKMLYIL